LSAIGGVVFVNYSVVQISVRAIQCHVFTNECNVISRFDESAFDVNVVPLVVGDIDLVVLVGAIQGKKDGWRRRWRRRGRRRRRRRRGRG